VSAPVVAVAYPGDPYSPGSWSGTSAGLIAGFESFGARAVGIDNRPPAAARALAQVAAAPRYFRGALPYPGRVLALADMGPGLAGLRDRRQRRALRRIGGADAIVQLGTDHTPTGAGATATLTDRTVAQALATAYPRWLAMPRSALDALIEREARSMRESDAPCVMTHWAADGVREAHGVEATVVGVGRNHEPAAAGDRDWSSPRFLFLGREWERKNGPAVLRAFARLRETMPGARLDVASGHPPFEVEGATGHGNVAGSEVPGMMAAATCLVVPSQVEPAGIVYVEAMAAGVPCIGTSVGGCSTFIGDAGRTVDPGDDDALLAAMTELADPERARELGERARARAGLFTWRAVAGRMMRALDLPGAPDTATVPALD
jgi:glycogen synthase